MKLETTRTFGWLFALSVFAYAATAWSEPALSVISAENGRGYCPVSTAQINRANVQASPDLLLLMYGLSQGRGA